MRYRNIWIPRVKIPGSLEPQSFLRQQGRAFLIPVQKEPSTASTQTVVTNWQAGLKKQSKPIDD